MIVLNATIAKGLYYVISWLKLVDNLKLAGYMVVTEVFFINTVNFKLRTALLWIVKVINEKPDVIPAKGNRDNCYRIGVVDVYFTIGRV